MSAAGKILVVDDEDVMREFLLEVFGAEDPIGARDGVEAIALLPNQPISVVITDLKMPRMDGLELLRRIKQHDPKIQVIVVTGYASLQTASECIQMGAADFLKKPFTIAQIRAAVGKARERAA